MKKSNTASSLENVYKDVMAIKLKHDSTIKSCLAEFYKVMRKHGIKQGTWIGNGNRAVANPEWNMAYSVLKEQITSQFSLWPLLNTPPKDLLAYGKRPKISKKRK